MNVPPLPLRDVETSTLSGVQFLCFDIDDTITHKGSLPEPAVRALYAARAAGLTLLAVTGRSFSWGEMFVRLFPVHGVVAETGAVALVHDANGLRVFHHEPDAAVRAELRTRRDRAAARVLATVPTARLSMDSVGRIVDVAFDLVEDGPPVLDEDVATIHRVLREDGLVTVQSSVHVNAWGLGAQGPFDKASMVARVLKTCFDTVLGVDNEALCYVGDSKNDGSMFARVPISIGVHNVMPHVPALAALGQAPRYVVDGSGGYGFAEVVSLLLDARTTG